MSAPHRRLTTVLFLLIMASIVPATTRAWQPVNNWQDFDTALATIAPEANFLAAEIVDGRCEPVHGFDQDRRLALGSTFKLYVLGELARQIAAGTASWDEQLPVQEALKSLPSGITRYDPPGTRHSLRSYAERMIAESDNTATDHLIDRLGRERIEDAQTALGHEAPELNVPFLMTRELFAFKIAIPNAQIDAYLAAPDAEQRTMLSTEVDPIRFVEEGWGRWVSPTRIDTVEWFASATEICRAMATLHEMSGQPGLAPVGSILALNRGGVFNAETWPYAGFKGGYEAGVYNLTWLLRRADRRDFVVTAGFNDPVNYIDLNATGALAIDAINRLAETP